MPTLKKWHNGFSHFPETCGYILEHQFAPNGTNVEKIRKEKFKGQAEI